MPNSQISKPAFTRGSLAAAFVFCLAPAASVAGGLAMAPAAALAGIIAVPLRLPRSVPLIIILLAAAIAWAALSSLWSLSHRPEQALRLILVAVFGVSLAASALALEPAQRRLVRAAMIACALVLSGLIAIEAIWDMPLNRGAHPEATTAALERNPGRGALLLVFFGFGALAVLQSYKPKLRAGLSVLVLAGMGFAAVQFDMTANLVAFVLGALAFGAGYAWPRFAAAVVGWVLSAWILLAPWVTLAVSGLMNALIDRTPLSWAMRIRVWEFAAQRVTERPWFGWGLDSSRAFDTQETLRHITYDAIPLHPHSVSLQIWLETGAIGAVLFAALLAACASAASKLCTGQRAAGAAAAAAFIVLGVAWNTSYGAWQEWFMALPYIAIVMIAAPRNRDAT